jgi:hypothetical protein
VLNYDAAGSGDDWTASITRPTSGMTADATYTLPLSTSTLVSQELAETITGIKTFNTVARFIDQSTQTVFMGIGSNAAAQLMVMGANDRNDFFGPYNSTYQGGDFRLDIRSGISLFGWYGQAAGGGSAAELMALTNAGVLLTKNQIGVDTTNWGTGGTAVGVDSGFLTTSPSSLRYKEQLTDLSFDSSKVYDLEVKEFTYKKDGRRSFGGIAEQVDEHIPAIVHKEVIDGELMPESISENKLVWLLLLEMKKLKAEIEILKAGQ